MPSTTPDFRIAVAGGSCGGGDSGGGCWADTARSGWDWTSSTFGPASASTPPTRRSEGQNASKFSGEVVGRAGLARNRKSNRDAFNASTDGSPERSSVGTFGSGNWL